MGEGESGVVLGFLILFGIRMFMNGHKILLLGICVLLIIANCTPSQAVNVTEEIAQPTEENCLQEPSSNAPFPISPLETSSLSELRSLIEEYLNSGGSASGLQILITDDQKNIIGSIIEVDLNKDNVNDILLSTTTSYEIVEGYKVGWIGVFECENGKYQASYAELGGYINYTKIKTVLDLLDTGIPQIFVEYEWDGGSCIVGLQVLAFSSDDWSWIFGNYLHCPATVSIRANQNTGKTEIIYTGIKRDVMGMEPDEEVTEIYTVKNREFQLVP